MQIEMAGWSSLGLRCPDVTIDLRKQDGTVPKVSLLQMPNGTGKTTTLELLNATLSGSAQHWDSKKVRSFRRNNEQLGFGIFNVHLLVDSKLLSIELKLDYENGKCSYKTTNPGSGGTSNKWYIQPNLQRFLTPQFLKLFIFDGELAFKLLDSGLTEADNAIDALCEIYLLDNIRDFAEGHWERSSRNQSAKTETGLKKWRDNLDTLRKRVEFVKSQKNESKIKLSEIEKDILDKKENINQRLSSVATVKEQFNEASLNLNTAKNNVKSETAELMSAMRWPQSINPEFARQLIDLRSNLDLLKLPENTSIQFFKELIRGEECICGRPMDQHAIEQIQNRSDKYLDADDAGIINALKYDIEQYLINGGDEDSGYSKILTIVGNLTLNVRNQDIADSKVRSLQQQLIQGGDNQLAEWQNELKILEEKQSAIIHLLKEIDSKDFDNTNFSDLYINKIWSIDYLETKINEATSRIAEITETVSLRKQTEIIKLITQKSANLARDKIKKELIDECNNQLKKILSTDPLQIDKIDRSLRLKGQERGSQGQELSVGYTFLMSLLNRGQNQFPLIVDSPTGKIDIGKRRSIGRLIPVLTKQFISFIINSELEGFTEGLESKTDDISYITIFRKTSGSKKFTKDLPANRFDESINAYQVSDRDYFYRFDIESENEE